MIEGCNIQCHDSMCRYGCKLRGEFRQPGVGNWNPGYYQAPQVGCICPPTSEQTCGNPICPRKPIPSAASIGATP